MKSNPATTWSAASASLGLTRSSNSYTNFDSSKSCSHDHDRGRTIAGLLAEFRSFTDLIAGLDAAEWTTPTRCAGWEVRDVAAHVVGQLVDTVTGAVGSRTADEQAAGLRHRAPGELAADLRAGAELFAQLATIFDDANWVGSSPIPGLTLGQGVHALPNDAYVHADDIRAAVGKPSDNGPGLSASLDFVLGALIRSDVASGEPGIAGVLAIPASGSPTRRAWTPTTSCLPPRVALTRPG